MTYNTSISTMPQNLLAGPPLRRPLAMTLAGLLLSSTSWAATFVVNDVGDAPLAGAMCTGSPNPCTLRAAIERANANIDMDTIAFGFGGVPTTIQVTQPLPPLTSPATMDGTTNGGTPNSSPTGTNAGITVRIDGAAAGPDAHGIRFAPGASFSVLRGMAITRFGGAGVLISANNTPDLKGVQILGNFIGTDGSGTGDDATGLLANLGGIYVVNRATSTQVGSDGASAVQDRNLIVARSDGEAVLIAAQADTTRVQGNLIGTDRSGTSPRGTGVGIVVRGSKQARIQGNVIGALQTGIEIINESDWHTIQANRIGVGADNVANIGGSGHGISIRNEGNVNGAFPRYTIVGGTGAGEGNTIAHWGGNGIRLDRTNVHVDYPEGHHWQGNSIYGNGALGVELLDTAFNQGANPALAPPVWALRTPMIGGASGSAAGTQVLYTVIDSTRPSATYRLEVFANTSCDASGFGEGQTWLGAAEVQTFPSGALAGTLGLPAMPPGHTHVAMTATFIGSNGYRVSSEFSSCVAVQGNLPASTPPTVGPGSTIVQTGTAFNHNLAQYVAATDGDAIQSYGLAGVLPPGVSFNPASGLLQGTAPAVLGDYAFTLSATDKDGTASAAFMLSVTAQPPPAHPGSGGAVTSVPTLGHAGLALLSALMAGAGALRRRPAQPPKAQALSK